MRFKVDENLPVEIAQSLRDSGYDAQTVPEERLGGADGQTPAPSTTVSETLAQIQALVQRAEVRVSLHGYDELADDEISVRDIVSGAGGAVLIEDYPDYLKGPCCLVLQRDGAGRPIHVVWGIRAGRDSPAVVVTAYRPDPKKWEESWQKRRT